MYRRLSDFLESYRALSKDTSRLLDTMDDRMLSQRVADGHRTAGDIAWHIVVTVPEMMGRTGLGLTSVDQEAPPPKSAAKVADAYRSVSAELLRAVEKEWNDAALEREDEMYGEKWPRGKTLSALIAHETHHRGQMTVLLRQAGAKVPGLFGPSKEEWAAYGMEAPPY
jgi:uncharacterized damage-inducible protein DinB